MGRAGVLRTSHRYASRALGVLERGALELVLLGISSVATAIAAPIIEAQQSPSSLASVVVLDGVTVVDVEHGERVPDQRVVITGTRIQAVGARAAVTLPRGARVVDARGKYLIPGLWDLHVHPREDANVFYPLFVANGVTGIRDAGSTVPIDTLHQWRREILAGTRLGPPRQILVGPSINQNSDSACADPPAGWRRGCVSDTATARLIVDSLAAAGVDMLKIRTVRPDVYFALAAEARRRHLPFGGHAEGREQQGRSVDFDDPAVQQAIAEGRPLVPKLVPNPGVNPLEASDSGAVLIDHTLGDDHHFYSRHCWSRADTTRFAQCQAEAQRFVRNGTWLMQTEIVELGYGGPALRGPGPQAHALFRRLQHRARQFWADSLPAGNWLGDSASAALSARRAAAADTTDPLYIPRQLGVPLLMGSDVTNEVSRQLIHGLAGFSLHGELALAVAEGLPPLTALRSATLNPATFLHATDSLGTIAVGKLADLVLLDADPLADITNTTAIRAVVANGRYYDRATLDRILADVRATPRPPRGAP